MEKTGCKVIRGAPTTLAVKGLLIMMMMMMMKILSVDNQSYLKLSLFKNKKKVIVIRSRAFLSSKGIDTESTTLTPRSRRRNAGNA